MNSEIIKMNSFMQNEFMVWHLLERRELKKVYALLDRKMALTHFMLTSMVILDYDDDSIIDVLLRTREISDKNVFIWLKNHFKTEDLIEVFKHFNNKLTIDYPSNEDCIKLELWDILVERGKWDIIAQNKPEILGERIKKNPELIVYLLKINLVKYGEIALTQNRYEEILSVKNGWKYLFTHEHKGYVFGRMKNRIVASMLPMKEIVDYCRQQNWLADLYKEELYDILLDNGEFSFFIENHSLYSRFLLNFPERVHWEELWEYYRFDKTYRNYLIEKAHECKNVRECKNFLHKHTGFIALLLD